MMYGVLSYSIVYMHTDSIAGAIDPYSLNLSHQKLTDALHMLFSTSVPSFFILWGYLSHKYLSDTATTPTSYLKNKILHFWPIYIFFSCFINIANIAIRHNIKDLLPIHSLILSILGFGAWFPSHIMAPLFVSLLVISVLKYFKHNKNILVVYTFFIFFVGNFLPDNPSSILIANLFFHTAFCLGILITEYDLLSFQSNRISTICLCAIGVGIYISYVFGLQIFFTRFPNSYGHLAISLSFLIIGYNLICIFFSKIPSLAKKLLCTIGTFAFAHMIIHIQFMNLFNTVGKAFLIPPVAIQVISLTTTPIISIYIIFPIYNYLESSFIELYTKRRWPLSGFQ